MEESEELKVIIGDHIRWQMDAAFYKSVSEYYMVLSKLSTVLCSCNDVTGPIEIDKICDEWEVTFDKSNPMVDKIRAEYKAIAAKLKPQAMPDYMRHILKDKENGSS